MKIKEFASENLQGQSGNMRSEEGDKEEEEDASEDEGYIEYISLPTSKEVGPGQKTSKLRTPNGKENSSKELEDNLQTERQMNNMTPQVKKEKQERSSSDGEYIEDISLLKEDDSKEDLGPGKESLSTRESNKGSPYRRQEGNFTDPDSSKEMMGDLGFPSSFSHQRTGWKASKQTFECTVCNVTLTSVVTKEQHLNGKRHLMKQNNLDQKNSEGILSVVEVPNPPPASLSKVPL